MLSSVRWAARGPLVFLVGLLFVCSSFLAPASVRAATDLDVGGVAVIADADGDLVRLREAPGYDAEVITLLPEGTLLDVLGGPEEADDGSLWYRVADGDETGYMVADYLARRISDGGGDATTTSDLNLRSGPSTADDVLRVMPPGAAVTIDGEPENGFYPVTYQGTSGWAYGGYLDLADDGEPAPAIGEAGVTSALNLRAGPSTRDDVLAVMPEGAIVEITGDPESGFYPVRYDGENGWAFGDYLDFGGVANVPDAAVIWPVSGGEWTISQGYNGSSHQNQSSTWQYYYSFDIIRTDGSTAGQPVYSPVDGSVRWTESGSGGISIDMGNGYAAAIFHITVDPGLSWGDPLEQGQYIGYISGPGGDGNMGFDHLHLSLWATDDGGNWSRVAVPFTGQNAIAGVEYPETGGYSQWSGTVFYP
ncbi:MAG: hypothetical protein QOF33_2928 [Thermomicrobiales bacterium]|jgi:uncharacterized protein YraI|nr:hypothetical protein [Thermomicrobiales bacterium]